MTNQTVKAKPGPKPGRKRGRPASKKEVVTFAAVAPVDPDYPVPASEEAPSRYHRVLNGFWVDFYDIADAYKITNSADQHAVKKMLMPGMRGVKTANEDRQEAIKSIKRAIQLDR